MVGSSFLVPGHLEWLHSLIFPSAAALHSSRTWPSSSAFTGFLCKDCLVFTVACQALPPCRIPQRGESSRDDWVMTGSPVCHWRRSSGQWIEVEMLSHVLVGSQAGSLCRIWCFPQRVLSAPGAVSELFYYICVLSLCIANISLHHSTVILKKDDETPAPIVLESNCTWQNSLLPQAQGGILSSLFSLCCPSSSGCFPCGPEQALDGTLGSCLWHFPWPAAPPRCPAKQQGLDGCHQHCCPNPKE